MAPSTQSDATSQSSAQAGDQPAGPAAMPLPQISLPKGGGAIQGIGEKFSTNTMTGTAALSVPIALSGSRSGFGASLSLEYDSGAGNGLYGVGWNLSLPTITRKTDKGLPRYRDSEESDVFILSGSEDLVPVLRRHGDGWVPEETERDGFRVRLYRPRIEGLFARIERWTRQSDGEIHWRTFSKDNVLTIYGDSENARISDPARPQHVFEWLIAASYDGLGNAIHYRYVADDLDGVDTAKPSERSRTSPCNRYPKRIWYGNRTPLHPDAVCDPERAEWMFEVVFDYGDEGVRAECGRDGEEYVALPPDASPVTWPVRQDPFSTYRSTFDIRTYRLCHRVLMFHRFPEELGVDRYLVRSTDLAYIEKPIGTFLTSVVQAGYTRTPDGAYLRKRLPPLDLGYTPSALEAEVLAPFELKDAEAANLPEGVDGSHYQWIDLDGEGISGALSEQGSAWYYKRNLGGGRFAASRLVRHKPATARLHAAEQRLLDIDGTGEIDLVDLSPGRSGFYRREREPGGPSGLAAGWGRFQPFRRAPVENWNDPNLRLVDLTGDGIADILVTEDVALRWHPSLLRAGFGPGIRVPAPSDEDDGPQVVFADPTQSIHLADMSGDGLSDIVRIRNGEVCYWPNCGYGHFGRKIVMDRSPWFDAPGLFDNSRIQLADTDGSGTTDIIYVAGEHISVYLNECGNALSERITLRGLPLPGRDTISVLDFLGRGTACLVWSSALRANQSQPLRYVDLMRGVKPHLLTRISNNLGAETIVDYASSTEFYLADKADGHPWVTPLPFPVHVVRRVESFDYISRHRFVSTTSYHHGYYDGVEREFRGFGRVDRLDAEEFDTEGDRRFPPAANEERAWHMPPVLNKTWYHTGVFLGVDRISRHLAHEYYREPGDRQILLEDTVLPPEIAPEEAREAARALKGLMLRQEVYALDGSDAAGRPYMASESNATLRLFQPRECNRHCVVFMHPRESVTLNYERRLYPVDDGLRADPRVSHAVTLEADDYGNVLKSVTVGYGRRIPDRSSLLTESDRDTQATLLATATENRYTNPVTDRAAFRTPKLAATDSYELTKLGEPRHAGGRLFGFAELRAALARASDGTHDLPFEDSDGKGATGPGPYRRLIQRNRIRYRSDDLHRLLPVGELEALALSGESCSLALTPGLVGEVYGDLIDDPEAVLRVQGGYRGLDDDGCWWVPSGRVFYSADAQDDVAAELAHARRHFFLPQRFQDPFGNVSTVCYDQHDLAVVESRDPVGNTVRARLDYRVLQPHEVTDANGNRSLAAFDALTRLAGTALMGKPGQHVGDSLDGFVANLPDHVVLEHIADPLRDPQAVLGNATTRLLYDVWAFARSRGEPQLQAPVTYSLARETHVSDLTPGEHTRIQHAFSYSDGFGREVQKKLQAPPGPIAERGSAELDPRWIGSGWSIYNNKGKPVRTYEPFFSPTHRFQFGAINGVATTLLYDPLDRTVASLSPDHTYQKTIFDPWRQQSWDGNDTVLLDPAQDPDIGPLVRFIPAADYAPTWYQQRAGGERGPVEQRAARKAAAHADTPQTTFSDPLGRAFLSIAHNRFTRGDSTLNEFYSTRSVLDIQGDQRAVIDALGRVAVRYDYDVRRGKIREDSADAGTRWLVNDINGASLLRFDSRGYRLRHAYDPLRRPTTLFVRAESGSERLAERAEYGESQPDAAAENLRGKLYRQYDAAGVVTTPSYDFKGNLLRSSRQMLEDYRSEVDWEGSPHLESEVLTNESTYDALNRPVLLTAPDGSVVRQLYNSTGLLDRLDVRLKGAAEFTSFVTRIDYDAKGLRTRVEQGNGTLTVNTYDPLTFRLTRLHTMRTRDRTDLQDLHYVYDPVGNISSIADAAQQTVYFRNQVVDASGDYTYDAIYQLISATGREHAGIATRPQADYGEAGRVDLLLPGDGHAMHRYREHYHYDAVGNIRKLIHSAGGRGDWRRDYEYSQIDRDNRLSASIIADEADRYEYDRDGNMTRMRHLPVMRWDFKNQLAATQTQIAADDRQPATTFYRYEAHGRRVRKVTAEDHRRRADRFYTGNFEQYREFAANGETVTVERRSLHVMDGDRRVAIVESRDGETTVRYQFGDHLDSCCLELDDTGAVLTYEEYYPYGSTSYQAGRSIAETSLKRYRFTGKERDRESGLYYFGARYLAPWLGRWTNCDQSGITGGINLYAYVKDNPVGRVDPSGFDDEPGWFEKNLGPASPFGQWVSHGDYFGSSILQNDQTLQKAQYVAEGVTLVAATVATAGLALEAAGAAGAVGGGVAVAGGTETAVVGTAAVAGAEGATGAAALAGTEATVATTAAATTGTGSVLSGLTAAQVTSLGTAGTALLGAASTPEGQALLQEGEEVLESAVPALENALPAVENALTTLENAAPTLEEAAETAESAATRLQSGGERVFYSVQDAANQARLQSGGAPWPTAMNKSLLGEGFYSWGSRAQAQAYLEHLEARGASGLNIIEARISETNYNALKTLDLRTMTDEAQDAWMDMFSKYGEGLAHGFEHVIRGTGNFGPEFYFAKEIFHLFTL